MNTELYGIRNLVFRYGKKKENSSLPPVLQIQEMYLKKNRVTVIRGHNGSGKSTLLKLLAGLLSPTEGRIDHTGTLRSVLVHQEPYMFHGTVLHNLTAPLRFQKCPFSREEELEKAATVLKMVDLEGLEKRKALELSGGEKKRVAIARALMTDPDVLLLDEPDAYVDHKTSRILEILTGELKHRGITTILCSHNRGFAYRSCDELIDLYQGCPVDHDENVFKGVYRYSPGLLSEFSIGDWVIRCPSRREEFTTAVIPPESFTLLSDPGENRKGNVFKAFLQEIKPSTAGWQTLSISGPAKLKIRISDAELSLWGLKAEDELTLMFNPSSVKLY